MSETTNNVIRDRPMRSFSSMIALAGIVAGAWFLFSQFDEPPTKQSLPEELADEPDLYIEEAIITQFRTNGALKYRLAAKTIHHFEADEVTHLLAPELTLYSSENPPWHLASKRGDISQRISTTGDAEEVVSLREAVTVRQQFEDGRHMYLYSTSLDLYPDRQYAETDQDVMIDTDVGRTLAVGLEAHLERGLLNFSSTAEQRVHTIVLPGQFK